MYATSSQMRDKPLREGVTSHSSLAPLSSSTTTLYFAIGSTGTGKSKLAVELAKKLRTSHESPVSGEVPCLLRKEGSRKRPRVPLTDSLDLSIFPHTFEGTTVTTSSSITTECIPNIPVIINCDVSQMFAKGCIDIATNKMSDEEMEGVPHLFMNFLDPQTGLPMGCGVTRDTSNTASTEVDGVKQRSHCELLQCYLSSMIEVAFSVAGRWNSELIDIGSTDTQSKMTLDISSKGKELANIFRLWVSTTDASDQSIRLWPSFHHETVLSLKKSYIKSCHELSLSLGQGVTHSSHLKTHTLQPGNAGYFVNTFVRDATLVIFFLASQRTANDERSCFRKYFYNQKFSDKEDQISCFNIPIIVCGGTNYYIQSLLGIGELCTIHDSNTENDPLNNDESTFLTTKLDEGKRDDSDGHKIIPLSFYHLSDRERWLLLEKIDPISANKFHENDSRRVCRRLEILSSMGEITNSEDHDYVALRFFPDVSNNNISGEVSEKVLHPLNTNGGQPAPSQNLFSGLCILWTDVDDIKWLEEKHDRRVDDMVVRGMVEEAKDLYDKLNLSSLPNNRDISYGDRASKAQVSLVAPSSIVTTSIAPSILKAIGYHQFAERAASLIPNRGEIGCPLIPNDANESIAVSPNWGQRVPAVNYPKWVLEAISQVKGATHRYAKQQKRWIQKKIIPKYMPVLLSLYNSTVSANGACTTRFLRISVDKAAQSNSCADTKDESEGVSESSGSTLGAPLAPKSCWVSSLASFIVDGEYKQNATNCPEAPTVEVLFPFVEDYISCFRKCRQQSHQTDEVQSARAAPFRCEVCDRVIVGGASVIDAHLKSKGHKGALKHEELAAKVKKERGIVLPPRKQVRRVN